jgi:hypothetical protein
MGMFLRTLNCAIDFDERGLLAGDLAEFLGAGLDDLRVLGAFTEAHVHDDLRDLRHGHHVGVPELLLQGRDDFLLVSRSKARHLSITPSHLRQTRTRVPSASVL